MAFESYYWKKDIKKDIAYVEKRIEVDARDFSSEKLDEHISRVEIKLFMMAFSVRKLVETQRLPDSVRDKEIKIITYVRNSKRERIYADYETLYDFDKPVLQTVRLSKILHQFIHAFFFQIYMNRVGRLRVIHFTSELQRVRCMYQLDIKTFLRLMKFAASTDVKSIHKTYNETKEEYVTVVK